MSYEVIRHSADGKAIAYIFDKMVKDNSAGHWQIGARFKGRGDREWIVIYVPSDSDHSYNGFIRLFNQEKGDIVIRPEEMAKAARLLTNFYNSPSLAGNEKRATQSGSQTSPKSVRHSAVDDDEVIDCTEDEVLEHSVTFKNVPFEYYAYTTNIGPYGLHITFRNAKKAELFDAVGDLIHLDFTKYEIYNQFTTIQKFKSGILNKFNEKVVSLRNTYGADSLMAFTKATISSQEASRAAAGGWALITDDPNWGIPTRDKTVSSGNSRSKAIKHSANPYPYRPSVELKGNQLVITFTDVSNNRTATASVNLVGCKNYKDVENRLDTVLTAAYEDGKDWGNISKQAFDSIMSQARALNIFNEKTWANANLAKRSKAQHSYTVISSQDELYHHGILGMKWGVRRYQNEDGSLTDAGRKHYNVSSSSSKDITGKKGIQKRLNDLDTAIARNKRHSNEAGSEADRYDRKAEKMANSHKSDAGMKMDEYERKADEARIKKKEFDDNIVAGQKEVEELLKKAVAEGYTIKQIETNRSTVEGRDAAKAIAISAVTIPVTLLTGMPFVTYVVPNATQKGTKYKLKDTKEGEEARVEELKKGHSLVPKSMDQAIADGMAEYNRRQQSSNSSQSNSRSYTPEQQREKLSEAKKNDRYDLLFVEAIQNTKMEYDNDKTAINNAYKEYLKDPDGFFTDPDFYKKYKMA